MSDDTDRRRLRVVVADDQAAVREPLAAVLALAEDIDVVAAASNGREVLQAVAAGPVDVVLMDLRMPVMDGIEATRLLAEQHPEVAVVVLTTFADDDSILGALSAGARGYLTKNAGRRDIARAIRAAAAGQSVLDREVQD
ncbi:response regulator, partial [Streptomyces hydrogenans]|uniref:response regulator n=1 Tax=Streptomyces hydrogenans TaxID=1873719 RepID=UPI0035DACA3A